MPPLLIVGGISGAGMTASLEAYRPIFMVVTFGFLAAAFYLTYRKSSASQTTSRLMTMNKVMLWCVTVLAVFFLFFPQYVTGWMTADEGFTADMHRSVLTVEGMTCPG